MAAVPLVSRLPAVECHVVVAVVHLRADVAPIPVLVSAIGAVGLLVAIAPAVWGVGQLFTGALSDRVGRKWLIAGGQGTEVAGLVVITLGDSFTVWAISSVLFGAGTNSRGVPCEPASAFPSPEAR